MATDFGPRPRVAVFAAATDGLRFPVRFWLARCLLFSVGMTFQESAVAREIIRSAIAVHRELGPGLLESAYACCLTHELRRSSLVVQEQVPIRISYQGVTIECAYRADMVVSNEILVEVKSVEQLTPVHVAQALTYLKLAKLRQALLINFNERLLKDGLRSLVL